MYLNFDGQAEEAFMLYKSVFGTNFEGEISRMGDAPSVAGQAEVPDEIKQLTLKFVYLLRVGTCK